jgi:hypothetical protein
MCQDLQQRYIFSRHCFGQKINHILRTTDLRLTEDIGIQFNSNSKPERTLIQSSLPTSAGGLVLTTLLVYVFPF